MLRAVLIACVFFTTGAASAFAQLLTLDQLAQVEPILVGGAGSEPDVPTTQIVIRPAQESKRALQYSLLPDFLDLKPGNAALGYMKAGMLMPKPTPGEANVEDKASDWLEASLAELPEREVEKYLDARASALKLIHASARRDHCEWELPIREETFVSILLPEVQEARTYARLVMLETRLHIKKKRYPEAVQALQTGYALARHIAEGPTLINGLVAIAVRSMTSQRALELMQQPDAPSLYWPLTALPQPLIDIRRAAETERNIAYLSYPMLRDVERRVMSVEEAQAISMRMLRDFQMAGAGGFNPENNFTTTVIGLAAYPASKAALIASGMPRERVDAMPVVQVLLIASLRKFDESRDLVFRPLYLPYHQAAPYVKIAEQSVDSNDSVWLPLAKLLLPAINSVMVATNRNQRNIEALRVVDALRLHAGKTGSLPEKLSDVTIAPIPDDSFSGKPFKYTRTGDRAVLEAELPVGVQSQYGLRYELRLEKGEQQRERVSQ